MAALVAATVVFGQTPKRLAPGEQTNFSALDDKVEKPVQIPSDVLNVLGKDDRVRAALEQEHLLASSLPPTWFSASIVHLASPRQQDLVVQALWPLLGANVTTFWVFLGHPDGYRLGMTAPALDLKVSTARWNGYRVLETLSATAVTTTTIRFRFAGTKYERYSAQTETIR